jgi:nucleoid-associated protein YgaU
MAVQTITVPSGNLFAIAAQQYGDATQWNRIAAANNMTDPFFTGQTTLTIPPADPAGGNGGILGE